MVLVNFGIDEEGRYLGNTFGVNMFETFNEIWKEFLESGRINTNEYRRMTLPQYYNTVDEFSRPLTDPANPVFQSGLRLENIRTGIVPCPFAEEFKKHGDVKRFADEYIPTIRSWNQSIFMGALDDSRPMQERQELIESSPPNIENITTCPWRHHADFRYRDHRRARCLISLFDF